MLHGQKNGALLKLQMKEEDSVTSDGELQRSTFNLHIFVLCCKISATFPLLEWIKILSVFGEERHQYTPCLVAIVGSLVTLKKTVANTAVLEDETIEEA